MNDSKIKVLYISHSAGLYGAERSLLQILSSLDRKKYSPIVALPAHGLLEKQLEKLNIPVEIIPSLRPWLTRRTGFMGFIHFCFILPFILISTLAIRHIIRRNLVKLVHSNTMVIVSGAIAAWSTGTPHIWHARIILTNKETPFNFILGHRIVIRTVLGLSEQVIAISQAVAEAFNGVRGSEKIQIIHNVVDIKSFQQNNHSSEFRASLNLPDTVPLIGQIANIVAIKGYVDFVRAVPLVRQVVPDAKFVCIGGMPHLEYKNVVMGLIEELKLSEAIILTGFREDVPQIIPALDIVVLASHYEAFGRVLVEAMAAGKPVVSTTVGGIPEVVVDGVTGLLVPPYSPHHLAQAIITILQHPEIASQMGAAGRARVEECFSNQGYINKIQKIYEVVLKT